MLDIKFVRENPDIVKENIRKKFQDAKLPLVDEVLVLDKENRTIKQEVEALRAQRNKLSKQIGALMAKGEKDEAEKVKAQMDAAYSNFQNAVDPDLIDCCIFESNAAWKKYRFLLRQAKGQRSCH